LYKYSSADYDSNNLLENVGDLYF